MKPKIRQGRTRLHFPTIPTIFLVLLWLISPKEVQANGHEPWPSAPAFNITEKEIPLGKEWPATEYNKHFEYSLVLEGQDESIFLARAYKHDSDIYRVMGFDAKSFEVVSLEPDVLLLASWSTAVQGSGSYTSESDVLLVRKEGKWTEIFRDTHDGRSKGGLAHTQSNRLTFSFDPETRTLLVRNTFNQFDFYEGQPDLLGKQVSIGIEEHNKGLPAYASSYSIVREWLCKLENEALIWRPGTCSLQLDNKPFRVQNVLTFLRQRSQIPGMASATEEDVSNIIKSLNPHFGDSGVCWGYIRIQNGLPKYEENRAHRYWMSPN